MGRPLPRIPGPAGALQEALRRGPDAARIEGGGGFGPDGEDLAAWQDPTGHDVGTPSNSYDSPWFTMGAWGRLLETLDLSSFDPDSPLLRTNIGWILNGGWRGQRVHRLAAVVVELFTTPFGDLKCVLMDPTGAIRCTVSKDVVALYPKAFRKGAALLLKEVPVLTVAEYTEHYLCVTQHELIQAFAPDETEVTESAEEIMEQEERMEGGGICPNINPSRTQPKRIGNVPSTHTNETEHEWFPEPRGSGRPPETLAREMHDAMQRVEAAAKELDEVRAGEMVSRRGNDERDKNQQENFEPAPLERAPDPDPTEPQDTTGEVSAFARAAANLLRRDD